MLGFTMNRFAPSNSVGVHALMAHRYTTRRGSRVPTSSTLQPLASPTTLAGLKYLYYPHAKAFSMPDLLPVPSIHRTLIYSTSELFDRLLCTH